MAIYNVLRLNVMGCDGDQLEQQVFAKHEIWRNLETALNELGAHGWEPSEYIFGRRERADENDRSLVAVIVGNQHATISDDLKRIVVAKKMLLVDTQEKLKTSEVETPQYRNAELAIKQLEQMIIDLEGTLSKLDEPIGNT